MATRHGGFPRATRKTPAELELMREAGRVVAKALAVISEAAAPGVSMSALDRLAEEVIINSRAKPSFKGYHGFPATICVEPDEIVVHGIPRDDWLLEEGQILGIDVGAIYEGYHGDAAITIPIGTISSEKQNLIDVTRQSLYNGLSLAKAGNRLRQVCGAIQDTAEASGYGVVRALVGHGIGRSMHEPVQVPNFVEEGQFAEYDLVLRTGQTFAIEPMINIGTWDVHQDSDGWTIRTADGLPSAHFEHTVAITRDAPVILTLP